jgi:hypoxanthine-guanine phosphoribosyltransferase
MSNGCTDKGRKLHKAVGHLSSPVTGRHVIIVDDIIDTGHTIEFCLEASSYYSGFIK